MCDRAYPKKLAFQYLEDLKNEFERGYGNQIETAARPYAFIKFGKLYLSFTYYALMVMLLFTTQVSVLNVSLFLLLNRYIYTED